jgi:hypothetical protein
MKKLVLCLTFVSMMCIAPGYGLRAQETESAADAAHELTPWRDTDTGKWGLKNKNTEEEAVPAQYDVIYEDAGNGFFLVGIQEKGYGFLDPAGKEIIPPKYECISFPVKGSQITFATICRVEKTEAFLPAAVKLMYFNDGVVIMGHGSLNRGYINDRGTEITPCIYEEANEFVEGRALVKLNGKWGYVDKTGNEIIPCKYEAAREFVEGRALVKLNGKWSFVDKTGNEIILCKYDEIGSFSKGLVQVRSNGKWGWIDLSCQEVIPCQYDEANSFSEGLARVGSDGKWGWIDSTGQEVIPCIYDEAEDFRKGKAKVRLNGKKLTIDQTGKKK